MHQRIEGYESKSPRETVSSAVKWIVMAGFYITFLFVLKMIPPGAVGGEVCSFSLHCNGEVHRVPVAIFDAVMIRARAK
jgi:hypothetical protein